MQWTGEETLQLISEVESRDGIWNVLSLDYKDRIKKSNAWIKKLLWIFHGHFLQQVLVGTHSMPSSEPRSNPPWTFFLFPLEMVYNYYSCRCLPLSFSAIAKCDSYSTGSSRTQRKQSACSFIERILCFIDKRRYD